MSQTECKCGKPTHNAYLCPTCTKRLGVNLYELATIVPTLASVAARESGNEIKAFTKHRRWTPEDHPLAFDEYAARTLREVYMCAITAAAACCTGFMVPEFTQRKVIGMLGIAAERAEVIANERDADSILDDVIDTLQLARKAIDPRAEDYGTVDKEVAMQAYLPVNDAINLAKKYEGVEVASSTAYRWIDAGKVANQNRNGRLHIMAWSLVQCARGVAA